MSGIHVHKIPHWCGRCGYRLTSHSTGLCRRCQPRDAASLSARPTAEETGK